MAGRSTGTKGGFYRSTIQSDFIRHSETRHSTFPSYFLIRIEVPQNVQLNHLKVITCRASAPM